MEKRITSTFSPVAASRQPNVLDVSGRLHLLISFEISLSFTLGLSTIEFNLESELCLATV